MALLEVRGVTVRFGGVTAVDAVDLDVEAGTVTALIGPNGAGKTTLFDVVTGLRRPDAGHVHVDGTDITVLPVARRAALGMARTFQRLEPFGSLSVRDNVRVAREIHAGARTWLRSREHGRVDCLIDLVGLSDYADQRADSVPTGVARLLELARALAIDPRILLLDEPSSGLDAAETGRFGDLLLRLTGEGRTVLMVEHDMELVMGVSSRVHVLDTGRLIASGTPQQVRADAGVQAAYLGSSGAAANSSAAARSSSNPEAEPAAAPVRRRPLPSGGVRR